MSIIRKILIVFACFVFINSFFDYRKYKDMYYLTNKAFAEYDLVKLELLEKELYSIISEDRLIPNIWMNWYFERSKQILLHLKKYDKYLYLMEQGVKSLSDDLSICLIRDKLKITDRDCYEKIRSTYFYNPTYDSLEFWTVHIFINKELAKEDLDKISDKTTYDIVVNMLNKSKEDILAELYPD